MIKENLTNGNHPKAQPAKELSTPEPSQNALTTVPADRAILLPKNEVAAGEKPVPNCTNLRRLKYDGDDVEDSFRESEQLEDKIMRPAVQPARDPLADVFRPDLLPDEHLDIRIDVHDLLANADEWLATPNSNFGGRRPLDLIGTPEEHLLRETIRSVIYSGMA